MSNKPTMKIVKRPWDKEKKKWAEEYGAVWEKVWDNGSKSYSVRFDKQVPIGEYVTLVMFGEGKPAQKEVNTEGFNSDNFDDDIPF